MYKSHLPVSFPFFKSAIHAPLTFSQGLGDESPNGSNKKKVEKKNLGAYFQNLHKQGVQKF